MPSDSPATSSLVARLDALYEYDREPVTPRNYHGWKVFWATFAGENIAGTEFVIGPLFVMHGCSARSVMVGLFAGNLLAVLSWALVCAPIAVRTRLTTYWQMRRMAGPWVTVAYSAVYGIIMCILAGAMLRVSMSSIALPFQNFFAASGATTPEWVWVVLAVTVGSVMAVLAVLGFEGMAIFSKMSAPWMVAIFIAGAIATLPLLGCHAAGQFWWVANHRIWTGVRSVDPTSGRLFSQWTIWHVIGFAWLCNMPQHIGMGDMTILRYARRWQMGFCSSAGMYLGHYCAWIASGVFCAAALARSVPTDPGHIAYLAAGLTGALCVVVAGWNVASPTLYRAGLALQVATPNWRRWMVTLVVGAAMIGCACVPAILAHLDVFLSTNALVVLPLGAFIFFDVWVLPRLGLRANFAEQSRLAISWPAASAWLISVVLALSAYIHYGANPIFLVLPEWALSVAMYVGFSALQQRLHAAAAVADGTPAGR